MIINHNIPAINTLRQMSRQETAVTQALSRLSSGLRINRAADDAADLGISVRMRAQIRSQQQAFRNTQDGISLIRTAEGALQEAADILLRMRELAVQASNGALTSLDRQAMQHEFRQLGEELDRIAKTTNFNTMNILDGSASIVASTDSSLLEAYFSSDRVLLLDEIAGRYQLDITAEAGQGQVKKSHIFGLMNGTMATDINTRPANGEITGLTGFSARGLSEGDYRIQTRAQPFGGIEYFNSPADLGVVDVRPSSTPNIMPFGEYNVQTAEEVPFMAIFHDYEGTGDDLIRGVDPTGRFNIDVRMDVQADLGATDAQTEVAWKDIGGAGGGSIVENGPNVAYQTDPTYDTNMYTHFRVNNLGPRDLLSSDIQAVTSYVSASGSEVDMELTYKSEAGAEVDLELDYRASAGSAVEMELTYRTASDSQIEVDATYQAKAGETISFDTTYVLPPTYNLTIENADNNDEIGSVDIGGQNLVEAANSLDTTFSGDGITFTVEEDSGTRRIVVHNNFTEDAEGAPIRISDDQDNELGLSSDDELGYEDSREGTYRDYEARTTINVEEQNIEGIADSLNNDLNGKGLVFSTEDTVGNTLRLNIENTGSYDVQIVNDETAQSVESVLGLNNYSSDAGSGLWEEGTSVFHDHTFEIDISERFLQEGGDGFLQTVQDAINSQSEGDASISGVALSAEGGTQRNFSLSNGSIYQLIFSDLAGGDWNLLSMDGVIERDSSRVSHRVHHEHSFSASVPDSNQNLEDIRQLMQNALSTELGADEITNPVVVDDVFQLESGAGSLDRIVIQNSGTADTRYQLKINSHSGAVDNELNLVSTTERGSSYLGSSLVHHANTVRINNIGDQNLEEINTILQNNLGTMLDQDQIANPAEPTFFMETHPDEAHLNRIEIRNTGDSNTRYAITITDAEGDMANQLNLHDLETNRDDERVSYGVYHEHTQLISVGDRDLEEIRTALQTFLQEDFLDNDEIVDTSDQDTFLRENVAAGRERIEIDNTGDRNTSYQIILGDHTGDVAEHLGIATTTNRDDSHEGTARDYEYDWGVVATNSTNIEELMEELGSHELFSTSWLVEPDYSGQYEGQFDITNIGGDDAENEKRRVTLNSGDGAEQLLGGEMILRLNETDDTLLWQARDRIQVITEYEGITNTGTYESGSSTDWWWEGVDGTLNPLVDNPDLGFTSLKIPDNDDHDTEWIIGDAWTLFTMAQGNADHDRLDFHLVDEASSATYASQHAGASTYGGGSYRFNNEVLDDSSLFIPQAVRMDIGEHETFDHRIQFGNTITSENDAAVYKERYQTGYNHYAHAYYGDLTTYYFANEGEWQDYIHSVEVWRQEDTNISMLFTVLEDGNLRVEGKGYHRNGTSADFEDLTIAPPGGGPVEIGPVWFDDLSIGGDLTAGDKFVINVAARAGHEDSVDTHGDLEYTDNNIAITGSPFQVMGSSMQYRFDSGAVDGEELDLLGYFVDPLLGFDDIIGVRTGQIIMEVEGDGFADGSRVGGSQRVVLEVNHHGTTEHIAAALLTGHYFQTMGDQETYYDFLEVITYEENQTQNASVVFEVIGVENDRITLRGQAHIYDRDGNYRYEFEDRFSLGRYTENLRLFGNCGEELVFSEFQLGDLSRFREGDRFSLSLAANAEPDDSTHDEIYMWGDDYLEQVHPHSWRFNEGVLDYTATVLRSYQVNRESGEIFDSEKTLSFHAYHGGTSIGVTDSLTEPRDVPDTVRFNSLYKQSEDMGTAHRYSRLEDISAFVTAEGRSLLEQPAVLTIHQGDKSVQVMLYAEDEVMDVIDRINRVIYEDLGQKNLVSIEDSMTFASFVNSPFPGSALDVMEGSIVVRSALPGQEGELVFSGDEELLRALGMTIIRESEENLYSINMTNKESGEVLARGVRFTGGVAPGVLPGMTLHVDSILGIEQAEFERCVEDFNYVTGLAEEVYVRLADRRKALHTGPNPGQIAMLNLGDISQKALGIANENLLTRDLANRAVQRIDNAAGQVSNQRANLGALENRLEHTMSNLMTASENLTSAESRIRDADLAREMVAFTKKKILLDTAYNVLGKTRLKKEMILELLQQNL